MRTRIRQWLTVMGLSVALMPCSGFSQTDSSLDVDGVVNNLKSKIPKFVVLVLDVSASMQKIMPQSQENMRRIVEEGLSVGDSVAVIAFEVSPTQVLKKTDIKSDADKKIVLDRIPKVVSNTYGSNLRWAHHEALKLLVSAHAPNSAVVFFSDFEHDAPKANDRFYPDYLKYYIPDDPSKNPTTPEAKDYERLKQQIGVEAFGWKIESGKRHGPRVGNGHVPGGPGSHLWIWIGIAVAVAVMLLLVCLMRRKAPPPEISPEFVEVRLREETAPEHAYLSYFLKEGDEIWIGGTRGLFENIQFVPGLEEPAAVIRRVENQMNLNLPTGGDPNLPRVAVRVEYDMLTEENPSHLISDSDRVHLEMPDGKILTLITGIGESES